MTFFKIVKWLKGKGEKFEVCGFGFEVLRAPTKLGFAFFERVVLISLSLLRLNTKINEKNKSKS